jgi:hypothetical protein
VEQVAQHRLKIGRTLYRLIEDVGKDAVRQKLDILGKEAEHQLVDEMGDAAFVVTLAQPHGNARELGRSLCRNALTRLGRQQPLRMEEAVAQQVPRLDRGQVGQRDDMLLRNRVGKIGVDTNFLHVRDNEQRRILESVGVLLQLRIRLDQVVVLALVLPGEAVPLPNIGEAGSIADLPGRFLEGVFGAMPIQIGRLRDSEEGAQIEKMFLSGRPLSSRGPSPSGNKLFGRHLWLCAMHLPARAQATFCAAGLIPKSISPGSGG